MGVELKVTPIRKTKAGWSAKERLSLNIFDFNDEYKREFKNASFLEKANLMELMYYEFVKDEPSPELFIKAATLFDLHDLPEEDKLIIEQDWNIIVNKIKEGKGEELSDSLTKYLGATTKGSKSEKNMTTQPFSKEKAHRRAFTLKGSYMTSLARQIMSGEYETIIKDIEELREKSFEELIIERFQPFIGCSKQKLAKKFNIDIKKGRDNASSALIAKSMLNLDGNIGETEEFRKAGIAVQIVTGNKEYKKTTEGFKINIPGETFIDPIDLVQEDWEGSSLNNYLLDYHYLLVVFERIDNEDFFRGVKFWKVPSGNLEKEIKEVWKNTQSKFSNGLNLTIQEYKTPTKTGRTYKVKNELWGPKKGKVVYVNTSGGVAGYNESKNATEVPVRNRWFNVNDSIPKGELGEQHISKHAWWFNRSYMYKQVKELLKDD